MENAHMKELLSAYVDGVLSPEEKARVEKHLEGCEECRAVLSDLRSAVRHLQGLADVEPPPGLAKKVMDTIKGEKRPVRTLFGIFRYPSRLGIPMQVAASAIIVATAAYMYSTLQPRHQDEAPREYAAEKAPLPANEEMHVAKGEASIESARAKVARVYDSIERGKPSEPSGSVSSKKMAVPSRQPAAGGAMEYKAVVPAGRAPQTPMMAEVPPAAAPVIAEEPQSQAPPAPPAEVALGEITAEEKAAGGRRADTLARSEESKTLREEAKGMHFIVYAKDVQAAAAKTEQVIRDIGGVTILSSSLKDKEVITANVPHENMSELQKALKAVGEIREIKGGAKAEDDYVRIVIEIKPVP